MVFQPRKWGLKRIAARVLLVPLLAGGSAAAAHAQQNRMPAAQRQQPQQPADPAALLKEGRKALAAGYFNDAQDLARRAEANNPSGKWGLFDDTPAALLKDVQAAVGKAQKAEADGLVKQAKGLLAKPAATDADRAANLDAALQMARRADQLHGPYSVWDRGDRADKLAKDIEAARAKVKSVPAAGPSFAATLPPPAGVVPAGGAMAPAGDSGVVQAGATRTPPARPAAPAPDAKKAAAVRLMAEGRAHADRAEWAAAHAKYTEAGKLGAPFSTQEPSPGLALQELQGKGAVAVNRLVEEARTKAADKDYVKAEAALTEAGNVAAALGLFARPIDEAKAALKVARAPAAPPATAAVAPMAPAAPAGPAAPMSPTAPGVAAVGGPAPVAPMSPALPAAPVAPPAAAAMKPPAPLPAAPTGAVTGKEMLDRAVEELRRGDFELARKLALEAHNMGAQTEARQLLTQIDAETFALKQRTANKSFDAAVAAAGNRDHAHALQVLVLIDPKLLPADRAAKRDELIAACKAEMDKGAGGAAVAAAGGVQPPPMPADPVAPPVPGVAPPGAAVVTGDGPKAANPDSPAAQAQAMRNLAFQKLRSEGLKVLADAQAAFGKGDTDVAIQMLADHAARVKGSGLDGGSVAMLLRPVDGRLDMFRVMKATTDAQARLQKENKDARALVTGRGAAEEQRKAEVQRLVRECNRLVREFKFAEAEGLALQAKQLDPDNEAVAALALMTRTSKRVQEQERLKADKEDLFYRGIYGAEKPGPYVDSDSPVALHVDAMRRARQRGSLDDVYLKSRSPKEFDIELRLDRPVSVEFNQTPLAEAVKALKEETGLPITWDDASLDNSAGVKALPVTEDLKGYSAKNALHLLLSKAKLSYVIEYESVRITSEAKAKGRLFTKVFSVADLVTPIPNYALPDYANVDKMFGDAKANVQLGGGGLRNGLGGGVPAGPLAGAGLGRDSGVGVGGGTSVQYGPRTGQLETTPPFGGGDGADPAAAKKSAALVGLITGMVRPYSWDGPHNGPGKVQFFDLGSALVVNQTADIIREVADLLEALRRLQDLAVAVEIRIISLSDTFFERMGVDFAMNVKTSNTEFEPLLTSRQFRPEPFLNDINVKGVTTGLTPAGAGSGAGTSPSFTPDLDVPFRATSFNYAIPGFGGYPNNPGFNGGVSLGLAFLNDIQVYLFMEAAQGNRRVNVMNAPKLTLFNGQTATITVSEQQFFVTNVQVFGVNGQLVFAPQNSPFPGPGDLTQGGILTVAVQAVVSADRRFVRLNLPVTLSAQTGATVPLFPFTTFIVPVFEGGSQGVPIPFTQFLQQPSFTTLNISTTVVCPDGGTVLLGGFKRLGEGRNEFGPPFLSKIPYLNRLFKNVGIGRETTHIMIMVTPRIIISAEEEIAQTETGAALTGGR